MANYPKFTPRTPGTVIADPAEFVALMEDATLNASVGLVWWGPTAPDVVTYPELTRSVWVDTSGATVALRSWDAGTSSWITEPILDGAITTGKIATGAVTIAKLSGAGGSTGNLLRVSSLGTIVFDDPANLFDASHRLPITSLSLSPVGDYVLTCNGTTQSWATFASKLAAQTITLASLDSTGRSNNMVLGQISGTLGWNYVATLLRDAEISYTKLAPGSANYILATNAAGTLTAWRAINEFLPPFDTGWQAMPTVAGTPVVVTHGLGSDALELTIWAKCITANNGYAIGDIVSINAFMQDDNTGTVSVSGAPGLHWTITTSQIKMYGAFHAGTLFKVIDLTTGTNAAAATTPGNWQWRAIMHAKP